jgi:hypothetical protein
MLGTYIQRGWITNIIKKINVGRKNLIWGKKLCNFALKKKIKKINNNYKINKLIPPKKI